MQPLLDLHGVSVVRDGTRILVDASLQVDAGEHWAIIGPNGSGKTTLLNVAAGRMFPTTGTVQVLGETLGRTDVRRLRPRIAFTGGAITRDMFGGSTAIAVAATGASGAMAEWWDDPSVETIARARSLLRDLGAGMIVKRPFGLLSEGERQKVMLARALMSNGELLLLDEPFAGLDTGAREKLLIRLDQHATNVGTPIVLVTHHLEELPRCVTHVACIADGRVVAAGPIDETLDSAIMSELFDVALDVEHSNGRWSCRAASTFA